MELTANFNSLRRRYLRSFKRVIPLALGDSLILAAAFSLTYWVRTSSFWADTPGVLYFVIFSIVISIGSLYIFGGYRRIWAQTSGHEVSVIILASVVSLHVCLITNFLVTPRPLPISVVLVSYLIALNGFVSIRYQSRLISGLRWRWRAIWHSEFPKGNTRVLIVGAGEAGQITAWRLKHRFLNGNNGHHIVGFVDDDLQKQGLYVEGSPVIGSCSMIPTLIEKYRVDLIVFAIHNVSGPRFREVLSLCEKTSARIKIVPDVFELINNNDKAPLLRDVLAEDLLGRQPIGWHKQVDAVPVTAKVVLITGAAGSIGSELCRQMLRYQPVQLVMVDNNESGLHDLYIDLKTEYPTQNIVSILADITHRERLEAVFARYNPQLVYHAAAYKHVPLLEQCPEEAIRVNIGGTLNVAEIAQAQGVERFVLISTDKAVNPCSVMGASKRICELLIQALALCEPNRTIFAAVRFGNVLGSRGSVVPTFNRQIDAGGPVTVTDQHMVRYFMSIPEAVNLVIHAACLTQGSDLFMLRMGEAVPIVELAERMIRLRGLRPHIDIPIEFTGVRPGEKLFEELCADFEETHATLHPDILRLNGTQHQRSPHLFLAQVRDLYTVQEPDSEAVLQILAQLAGSVFYDQPGPR